MCHILHIHQVADSGGVAGAIDGNDQEETGIVIIRILHTGVHESYAFRIYLISFLHEILLEQSGKLLGFFLSLKFFDGNLCALRHAGHIIGSISIIFIHHILRSALYRVPLQQIIVLVVYVLTDER